MPGRAVLLCLGSTCVRISCGTLHFSLLVRRVRSARCERRWLNRHRRCQTKVLAPSEQDEATRRYEALVHTIDAPLRIPEALCDHMKLGDRGDERDSGITAHVPTARCAQARRARAPNASTDVGRTAQPRRDLGRSLRAVCGQRVAQRRRNAVSRLFHVGSESR